MLWYPWSSKTFFKKVITVVKLVPSLQGRAQTIWKLNHYIYSQLINPRPTVVANKWKHNISQDWELLANSYDDISNGLIDNAKLLWLNLHILALGYLEEKASHFTELPNKDKGEEEDDQAKPQVSDLEEEKNK